MILMTFVDVSWSSLGFPGKIAKFSTTSLWSLWMAGHTASTCCWVYFLISSACKIFMGIFVVIFILQYSSTGLKCGTCLCYSQLEHMGFWLARAPFLVAFLKVAELRFVFSFSFYYFCVCFFVYFHFD